MPMRTRTRSSVAPTVRATHEPNEKPAVHSSVSGYRAAIDVERRAEVGDLARPFVPRAFAAADAAEVEAEHRAPDPRQCLRRPIHRLRVHRPAFDGQRMAEDHCGAHRLARRQHRGLEQRLESAGGPLNLANGLVCHQTAILLVAGRAMSGYREAKSAIRFANSAGRVIVPMCPVRSRTASSAPGMRSR